MLKLSKIVTQSNLNSSKDVIKISTSKKFELLTNVEDEKGNILMLSKIDYEYTDKKNKRTASINITFSNAAKIIWNCEKIRFINSPSSLGQPKKYSATWIVNYYNNLNTYCAHRRMLLKEKLTGRKRRRDEETSATSSKETKESGEKESDESETTDDVFKEFYKSDDENPLGKGKKSARTLKTDVEDLYSEISNSENSISGSQLIDICRLVITRKSNPEYEQNEEGKKLLDDFPNIISRVESLVFAHEPQTLLKSFLAITGRKNNLPSESIGDLVKATLEKGSIFRIPRSRSDQKGDVASQANLMNQACKNMGMIGYKPRKCGPGFKDICSEWKELFILLFFGLTSVIGIKGGTIKGELLGLEYLLTNAIQNTSCDLTKSIQDLMRCLGSKYSSESTVIVIDEDEDDDENKSAQSTQGAKKSKRKRKKKKVSPKPAPKSKPESFDGFFHEKILQFIFHRGQDITRVFVERVLRTAIGEVDCMKAMSKLNLEPKEVKKKVTERIMQLKTKFFGMIQEIVKASVVVRVVAGSIESAKKEIQELGPIPTDVKENELEVEGEGEDDEESVLEGEEAVEPDSIIRLEYEELEDVIEKLRIGYGALEYTGNLQVILFERVEERRDKIYDLISGLPEGLLAQVCKKAIREAYPNEAGSRVYYECVRKDFEEDEVFIVFNMDGDLSSDFLRRLEDLEIGAIERTN